MQFMELKKKILHFHFYWISIFFSAAEISRKENKRLLSSSSAILNQKQIKVISDNVILYVNKSAGYETLPGFSGQVFDKKKPGFFYSHFSMHLFQSCLMTVSSWRPTMIFSNINSLQLICSASSIFNKNQAKETHSQRVCFDRQTP